MKLLIISNMYPSANDPVYGTFVKVFADSMKAYNSEGVTQLIVIRGRDGGRWKRLLKYVSFYVGVLYNLLFHTYDLVYVHTIAYPVVPIRLAALFRHHLPLVFNVHGGDVLTRSTLARFLRQRAVPLLRRARMVVSPSTFFKAVLLREFPFLEPEKITVSPSGGVAPFFYRGVGDVPLQSVFTLGYVSRIDDAKGWDTFLEAVAELRRGGIRCKAVVVGRGAKVNEMRKMIDDLSLQDCVTYKGPVPYESLPDVYRSFSLFVFPTCLEESLGLVGLEAMACGVPVIGSRIGGLTDYLEEGRNGFFFRPGDVEQLVAQVRNFLSLSPDEQSTMSAYAYHTALKYRTEYVQQSLCDKLINIV